MEEKTLQDMCAERYNQMRERKHDLFMTLLSSIPPVLIGREAIGKLYLYGET